MRLLYSISFCLFFVVSCLIFFSGALVVFAITRAFDRNGRILHLYSCIWGLAYFYCNPFWRLRVEHRERIPRHGAAVLVANHSSMFDIIVLYALFRPFKWVAKASVLKIPFVGWNMVLNQHVALVRGDAISVAAMMAKCERWLERGVPVMLFPEGTRSPDGSILPFKDGAFRLATKMGCPVIPVVIQGTETILPKHGLLLSLKANCAIRVLSPVDSTKFGGDVGALRNHVRDLIVQEKQRVVA